jgi:hypothetical protein
VPQRNLGDRLFPRGICSVSDLDIERKRVQKKVPARHYAPDRLRAGRVTRGTRCMSTNSFPTRRGIFKDRK